jgi:diacylglycerol kinase (ATP)
MSEALVRELDGPIDLVVAAGGDGTVTKLARRLVGRGVPLAILPLGTSNNIATALGVPADARQVIAGLPTAARRPLDVPTARAPWGAVRFVEAAGLGVFAAVLRDAYRARHLAPDDDQSTDDVEAGGRRFQRMLARRRPRRIEIVADGRDLSGHYLLVEVMNISQIGARARLAPHADPGDGMLDLVLVGAHERDSLGAYLAALAEGEAADVQLPTVRARHIRCGWRIGSGHLDDKLWPPSTATDAHSHDADHPHVEIEVVDQPIEVIVA